MKRDLGPPDAVHRIARTLEKAGFETWCVGGAVRDALLGHAHLDWDLATAARPADIRRLFPRTVPVGIAFGTVGVLDENGILHEVTTFRRDVSTDGRHAEVEFGVSLEEDLARRDFTINSIAYHPVTQEVRDPWEGQADLERRLIRAVGEAGERMREDRLRALRGIRFAARFEFGIDPATWDAIVATAAHLGRLSPERVKQELEKTMDQVRCPSTAFIMWRDCGAFGGLIPSLENVSDRELRATDHIAMPLAGAPAAHVEARAAKGNRRILRLTALFAGASGHAPLDTLKALRFSNSEAGWITGIVTRWRSLEGEMRSSMLEGVEDALLRKWAAVTGRTRLATVLRLAAAKWAAERDEGGNTPSPQVVASAYRRAIRVAYRDPVELSDLAVDGRDMEKLGIRGPAVGATLRRLLETVITDPALNQRASLMESARKLTGATTQ